MIKIQNFKMYIDGQWVQSESGKTIETLNPENNEVLNFCHLITNKIFKSYIYIIRAFYTTKMFSIIYLNKT